MSKYVFPVTCLIFILFGNLNFAFAQDELINVEFKGTIKDTKILKIVSLDGKNREVKIIPSYVNKVLKICYLKDTISISGFWGVPPEIHVLIGSFIEMKYEVRGGSNLGLGNTMVVCVKGEKLYEAMHVLRYSNWESGDLKTNYNIKLTLYGNNKSNYKLKALIYDKVNSKLNTQENYNYHNQTTLNFDTKRNVFYSVKENIYNHIIIDETSGKAKQKVSGNFPVVILGKETYCFVNERWYHFNIEKELTEFH